MSISASVIIINLIFVIIGVELANSKNHNPVAWAILSFFFGLVAILILVIAERKPLISGLDKSLEFDARYYPESKPKDALSLEMTEKDMEFVEVDYDIGYDGESAKKDWMSHLGKIGLFFFMLVLIGIVISILIITS